MQPSHRDTHGPDASPPLPPHPLTTSPVRVGSPVQEVPSALVAATVIVSPLNHAGDNRTDRMPKRGQPVVLRTRVTSRDTHALR
jgi:hypothetical protein